MCLENIGKYNFFRQLWLVLGVKLMEINSNWFSRWPFFQDAIVTNESVSRLELPPIA